MRECRGRRLTGQRQTGAHELKRLSPFGATATTTLPSRDPAVHRPFGRFVAAFDPLVPAPRAAWLRIAAVRGEVMTPGVFDPKKGTGRPRLCAGEVRKHTRTLRSRGIKGRSDPGLGRSLHFKVLLVVGDVKRSLASLPRKAGRNRTSVPQHSARLPRRARRAPERPVPEPAASLFTLWRGWVNR
jgi:hypothetical protein